MASAEKMAFQKPALSPNTPKSSKVMPSCRFYCLGSVGRYMSLLLISVSFVVQIVSHIWIIKCDALSFPSFSIVFKAKGCRLNIKWVHCSIIYPMAGIRNKNKRRTHQNLKFFMDFQKSILHIGHCLVMKGCTLLFYR